MFSALRVLQLTFIFLQFRPCFSPAQSLWSDIREESIQANPADRLIQPNRYRTLRLDIEHCKALLLTAPAETEVSPSDPGLQFEVPMPDGRLVGFEVWEAPVMAPELTLQYPDIRSFEGRDLDGEGMIARFDISPNGFHGMLLNTAGSTVFIDPYARGNTEDYLCYYKKDFVKRDGSTFVCQVSDIEAVQINEPLATERAGTCGNRRHFRLALACTGEYANFHGAFGADKAPAIAAMNTSMTRVNGVFERDASIRMILVANNANLVFTDPATDPYTNGSGSMMLGENQTTCDNLIGSSNYDIGHVFSTGGGGVAALNSPCNNSIKAQGVTGQPNPVGDPFDIDYVAHEMGHQYGAQHTQYNDCNRVNSSAMEPGSASTIMGYAGICSPNVQSNSDDYFHARSLQQFATYLGSSGSSCATLVATGNIAPVVSALTNRNIPKSTPFVLSGSATDANGDPMTYCWEQMNALTGGAQPMPPEPTNMSGPVFRSLVPVSANSRYFPHFDAVLANLTPTWEVLPSVNRTLNFRFTVRDNHAGGGCTSEQNMTVTTSSSIGPFLVTVPNGKEVYPEGSTQTIQWDVAGTTGSPVSCANVNILLSTDGGASFTTLIANTPNDGSQAVTFNVSPTSTARIMVQAVGNVFYDVSNGNFEITQALPVELMVFDARAVGAAVQIEWSTATETNNNGYFIERSEGDASGFQQIGWVPGQGTTTLAHHYRFDDRGVRPGVSYYYRLRQTDFDGQFRYSDIRIAMVDGSGAELSVTPNPARETIRVIYPDAAAPHAEGSTALIFNMAGRVVGEYPLQESNGTLDIREQPPGLYFIRMAVGGQVFPGKFVKY